MNEIREGRGPVFIETRHLSEKDMAHLKATLGYDKDTLPDFFAQKKIDIAREPVEVMVSEFMQKGVSEFCGSGIKVNPECASNVPGLYAAGLRRPVQLRQHGLHERRHGGSRGCQARRADKDALGLGVGHRQDGISTVPAHDGETRHYLQGIRGVIQRIMTDHMGVQRTKVGWKPRSRN